VDRDEVRIERIFRVQPGISILPDQSFQSRLIIDQSRDDVALAGYRSMLQQYDVTIEYVATDHGVT
jgi:hypothetical protein